jgi:hypothetical protein
MADNVETLGNFSNPVVPKPISKMSPSDALGEVEKAGKTQQASYKNLGEQTAEFDIKKANKLSEEATRQSDLGMAEIGKTRQALAEVSTPTFKPSQETFIGMSSLAGLIAFVGSAMGQQGKQSGKAAIDSMTGMMKGYQTGRQDVFRREQIQFEKELQTMKSLNDKLLKDLTLAQEEMKFNFSKGQADAAVAIAGYAGPVTKAKFENEGNDKALNFTAKLSEGVTNIYKIAADIGLKQATLAQTKEIAMAKASNQGILKPSAKVSEGYVAQNILSNDLSGLINDLKNPNLQKQISDNRIEAFLTEEGKVLNQLIAPNMPTELRQFLTKVRDIRNNYYLDISGKAVTGGEALRNYGTVPQPADTPEVILDKINSMKGRIDKKIQINQYLFKLPAIPSDLALAGTKTSLVPNQNYEQPTEEEIINVTEGLNKGKYKKTSSGSYIRVD